MGSVNQKVKAAHYDNCIQVRSGDRGEISKAQIIKDITGHAIQFWFYYERYRKILEGFKTKDGMTTLGLRNTSLA